MPRDPVLLGLGAPAGRACAWILLGPGAVTTSWVVQVGLDVAFVYFSWQIVERFGTDRLVRRFWRAMSLGGLFFTTGDVVQTILTLGDQRATAASGTAQTILVATGVACIVWAMLTHPLRVVGRERLRLWLDAATVMAAAVIFAWSFSLSAGSPNTPAQVVVAVVGSGLMLVSALGMVKLLLSGTAPFTFQAGVTGGTAAALVGFDTSMNSIVAEASDARLLLVVRLLPCFLLTACPRVQQIGMLANPSGLARRRRPPYSRLPYIAVGATQVLLIAELISGGLDLRAWGVVIGVVGITALVVVRQTVALTDNAELLGSLDASVLQLSRQEQRFRSLVQYASDITLVVDAQGYVKYASPALFRVLGVPPDTAVHLNLHDLIHPEDQAAGGRMFAQLVTNPQVSITTQLRARHTDGSWHWLQLVATNLLDDASVAGIILNARDVTEGRQLHERLKYDATHDTLTSLANRALFDEQIRLVASRAPHPETEMAILAIDLDDFKPVNDMLGHHVGDALLVAVADRLRRCVLPTDMVARLGGDEFAVLLPGTSRTGATSVANRILASFTEPVVVEGHELAIRASLGIAVGSGAQIETLLRDADAAMYTVKHNGKGSYLYAGPISRPHPPAPAHRRRG
jgi:diguanylate cyclase (GGDEF)-like protein/PAS domain S-box-containing protein